MLSVPGPLRTRAPNNFRRGPPASPPPPPHPRGDGDRTMRRGSASGRRGASLAIPPLPQRHAEHARECMRLHDTTRQPRKARSERQAGRSGSGVLLHGGAQGPRPVHRASVVAHTNVLLLLAELMRPRQLAGEGRGVCLARQTGGEAPRAEHSSPDRPDRPESRSIGLAKKSKGQSMAKG